MSEPTYTIKRSAEDDEWVALRDDYPSMSWLASTPSEALQGLQDAIIDLEHPQREMTSDDFKHALTAKDHRRLRRGEFQPGDVELIRKFLRLTEEQALSALAAPSMQMAEIICLAEMRLNPGRNLLLLAIREPGAFCRALVKQ